VSVINILLIGFSLSTRSRLAIVIGFVLEEIGVLIITELRRFPNKRIMAFLCENVDELCARISINRLSVYLYQSVMLDPLME